MQKVFEKIINKIQNQPIETFVGAYGNFELVRAIFDSCCEIVEQTAEEYNNGWIPCSERLPEEGGYYLVTYHGWSNGDYLPKFDDTYCRRLHYQKSERFTGWNHPRYC